ncbi:MAG TPA: DNA cytosine methyltransferase [Longimicrobiales bacterium]
MSGRKPKTSIELFTGAGGLALGVAEAGFRHVGVIEWNPDACKSLSVNKARVPLMADWDVREVDVHGVDFKPYKGKIHLIAAGAPCQPFSLAGKHRGHEDDRNLFPQVFRAVKEALPDAVIVENVKGLLRKSFRDYFDYIIDRLTFPGMEPDPGESWREHKLRLEDVKSNPPAGIVRYDVRYQLLNAANFGVPQKRERVFIVAFRSDLGIGWANLKGTHSEDALLYAQWVDGSYWEEHGMTPPEGPPERLRRRVERLREQPAPREARWRTVRDALKDLPEPKDGVEHPTILNHVGNPGARIYPGHTGSPLDEPAKTLKAGDHGVPGGENMLRRLDGSVRYFTVREAARVQGFPDEYNFQGAWTEAMRQLGNAVPVPLARAVAGEVMRLLESTRQPALVA